MPVLPVDSILRTCVRARACACACACDGEGRCHELDYLFLSQHSKFIIYLCCMVATRNPRAAVQIFGARKRAGSFTRCGRGGGGRGLLANERERAREQEEGERGRGREEE